jgi:hypothetical protein
MVRVMRGKHRFIAVGEFKYFREVQRASIRRLLNLLSTTEAVGDDQRLFPRASDPGQ